MAIDAVLFDYSGVLTTPLNLPTGPVPYDPDVVLNEMVAALASEAEHPWKELERGEITLADYIVYVEDRAPGAGALFALESDLNVMANLDQHEDRLTLAAELKAEGLRVGVVTNNVAEWEPLWRPHLPAGLFDTIIDSAQVGCRKPEPRIYQLAMEAIGIDDPARVLFIDDFEWNVTAAERFGMHGLHCAGDVDLRAAVRDRFVAG